MGEEEESDGRRRQKKRSRRQERRKVKLLFLHQYGANFCLSGFFIPLVEGEILAV